MTTTSSPNEIRFACPNCGLRLACEDGYGGWRIQCPQCNGGVVVPLRSVPVRTRAVSPAALAGVAGSPRTDTPDPATPGTPNTFSDRAADSIAMTMQGLIPSVAGLLVVFGLIAGGCCSIIDEVGLKDNELRGTVMFVLGGVAVLLFKLALLWERWDGRFR